MKVNNIEMFVERIQGNGDLNFILLHNAGGNRHFFIHQIELLKKYGNVIWLDLPGHNGSKAISSYQMRDLSLKALAVVAHRHIYINHTDGSITKAEIDAAAGVQLTRTQTLACRAHALADTIDGAAEFKVAINAAVSNPSLGVSIGLDTLAFFAGAPTAIGELLTVQRSAQISNRRALSIK